MQSYYDQHIVQPYRELMHNNLLPPPDTDTDFYTLLSVNKVLPAFNFIENMLATKAQFIFTDETTFAALGLALTQIQNLYTKLSAIIQSNNSITTADLAQSIKILAQNSAKKSKVLF